MDVLSWKQDRPKLKGAIVLARRPGENGLVGLIETSLFMRWSTMHVRYWWTDLIINTELGLSFDVDGMHDAKSHAEHCRRQYPSWDITAWDANDPAVPVIINWNAWANAGDKFGHRNPMFVMKE